MSTRRTPEASQMPKRDSPKRNDTSPAQGLSSPLFSSGIYPRTPTSPVAGNTTTLDLDAYLAWVSGHPVSLRAKEQQLLALLEQSSNRVLRADDLMVALYGRIDPEAGRARLRRLVADIRMRLGADFADRLRTVHGVGFVLVDEASDLPPTR